MNVETLKNGTKVYYAAPHTFGEDALLLAEFARSAIKPQSTVMDAGTGCGIIALYLYDRAFRGKCTAIDISDAAINLLEAALKEQGIECITPLCADLRQLKANSIYDVIVCNPPYFKDYKGAAKSADAARANARHEAQCNINDVCALAKRALKNGGKLCLCMKPQRLADVICSMRAHSLEPKRLQAVCSKTDCTPRLYLIEARKNRAAGLEVLPPIFP